MGLNAGVAKFTGLSRVATDRAGKDLPSGSTMLAHVLLSGRQPYVFDRPCVVHMPVPGSNGLCVVLQPRYRVPACGSAAALFLHYAAEGQHLRLDYGYSNRERAFHYHWQHDRSHADAGLMRQRRESVPQHVVYGGRRYYRFRGRALLLLGRAIEEIAIVEDTALAPYSSLKEIARV